MIEYVIEAHQDEYEPLKVESYKSGIFLLQRNEKTDKIMDEYCPDDVIVIDRNQINTLYNILAEWKAMYDN